MAPENSPSRTLIQDIPPPASPPRRQHSGPLPPIEITVVERFLQHSFVYPNPWCEASGCTPGNKEMICRVGFGVSPLADRVYVSDLHVDELHRRRGYATALLAEVARYAGKGIPLAVTPLHESIAAHRFWTVLRAEARDGLIVTRDVRVSEMESEQQRWRGVMLPSREF